MNARHGRRCIGIVVSVFMSVGRFSYSGVCFAFLCVLVFGKLVRRGTVTRNSQIVHTETALQSKAMVLKSLSHIIPCFSLFLVVVSYCVV